VGFIRGERQDVAVVFEATVDVPDRSLNRR
jgi:hypothetical protein